MKKFNNQKPVQDILAQLPTLGHWHAKIDTLTKLDRLIKSYLSPQLAQHCNVANLRNGAIILTTHTPSWNHQLRFLQNDLLEKVRKHSEWCFVSRIECKTIPKESPVALPPLNSQLHAPSMNAISADIIREAANLCDNPKLKLAMERLAQKGFNK